MGTRLRLCREEHLRIQGLLPPVREWQVLSRKCGRSQPTCFQVEGVRAGKLYRGSATWGSCPPLSGSLSWNEEDHADSSGETQGCRGRGGFLGRRGGSGGAQAGAPGPASWCGRTRSRPLAALWSLWSWTQEHTAGSWW